MVSILANPLSQQDIDRLTAWSWRYTLEAHGFTRDQAMRLIFLRYYHRTRKEARP